MSTMVSEIEDLADEEQDFLYGEQGDEGYDDGSGDEYYDASASAEEQEDFLYGERSQSEGYQGGGYSAQQGYYPQGYTQPGVYNPYGAASQYGLPAASTAAQAAAAAVAQLPPGTPQAVIDAVARMAAGIATPTDVTQAIYAAQNAGYGQQTQQQIVRQYQQQVQRGRTPSPQAVATGKRFQGTRPLCVKGQAPPPGGCVMSRTGAATGARQTTSQARTQQRTGTTQRTSSSGARTQGSPRQGGQDRCAALRTMYDRIMKWPWTTGAEGDKKRAGLKAVVSRAKAQGCSDADNWYKTATTR